MLVSGQWCSSWIKCALDDNSRTVVTKPCIDRGWSLHTTVAGIIKLSREAYSGARVKLIEVNYSNIIEESCFSIPLLSCRVVTCSSIMCLIPDLPNKWYIGAHSTFYRSKVKEPFHLNPKALDNIRKY